VVLLPPTLVKLQRLARSQGAKDGYITPKAYLSPFWGEVFFAREFFRKYRIPANCFAARAVDALRFSAFKLIKRSGSKCAVQLLCIASDATRWRARQRTRDEKCDFGARKIWAVAKKQQKN
jgi:hypothetical protein